MKSARHPLLRASTLVITLSTLVALSLLAAFTLLRVAPRIRMAYQNAAWQEARVAAEAGVDCAMGDLRTNATGFQAGAWPGWQQETTPAPPPRGGGLLGSLLSTVTGVTGILPLPTVNTLLSSLVGKASGATPATLAPVTSSAPIYLDNLRISAVSGVPAEVDVRLWALNPGSSAHTHWFRIRSMATCALPPMAYEAPANLDSGLRRFSLHTLRPSLRRDDAGRATTVPFPNVSRTVEALVEPILPFELALWSGHSFSLAPTGHWNIDSFDSGDDAKSAAGLYPGRGAPQCQANGSIACGEPRPFSSLYGPAILASGAQVKGALATNGGDDPSTTLHENVTGTLGLDLTRVRDDFQREMPPLPRPVLTGTLPPPAGGTFIPGTETDPAIYAIPSDLTQVRIASPPKGTIGALVLLIDGSLDLAGPLILPPTVVAILFVRGNITSATTSTPAPGTATAPPSSSSSPMPPAPPPKASRPSATSPSAPPSTAPPPTPPSMAESPGSAASPPTASASTAEEKAASTTTKPSPPSAPPSATASPAT